MTKLNMVERHREQHCNNDKRGNPKIEIEIKIKMKSLEESKGTKANNTSEYLLMKRIQ